MIPPNNIQWLRLIFATQVFISHLSGHFSFKIPNIIGNLPGVPAFFFVSGFLIYDAYQRKPGWVYAKNRFLRLFPGLLVVTLGSAAILLSARGWSDLYNNCWLYARWVLAQITIVQAYNPDEFRSVGIGEMNGSLWTITVEILFYVSVPFIAWLDCRFRWILFGIIAASFTIYCLRERLDFPIWGTYSLYGAFDMTPITWGWMFGVGIISRKYFRKIYPYLHYAPWALVPLIALIWVDNVRDPFIGARGNRLGLIYFWCFCALILWVAFRVPCWRLKPDFSYGIYIWHMPVINLVVIMQFREKIPVAIILTILIAVASWYLVEKPAEAFKRRRGGPSPEPDIIASPSTGQKQA